MTKKDTKNLQSGSTFDESEENDGTEMCRSVLRQQIGALDQSFETDEILSALFYEIYTYGLWANGGDIHMTDKLMKSGMKELKSHRSDIARSLAGPGSLH